MESAVTFRSRNLKSGWRRYPGCTIIRSAKFKMTDLQLNVRENKSSIYALTGLGALAGFCTIFVPLGRLAAAPLLIGAWLGIAIAAYFGVRFRCRNRATFGMKHIGVDEKNSKSGSFSVKKKHQLLVLCVRNEDYPASLELRKVYSALRSDVGVQACRRANKARASQSHGDLAEELSRRNRSRSSASGFLHLDRVNISED